MSANDISIGVGMILACYIGGEMGFIIGSEKRVTPFEASQILARESKRVRNLLKPQRRYIPYAG